MAVGQDLESRVILDVGAVSILKFYHFVFHVLFVHLFARICTSNAQQQIKVGLN